MAVISAVIVGLPTWIIADNVIKDRSEAITHSQQYSTLPTEDTRKDRSDRLLDGSIERFINNPHQSTTLPSAPVGTLACQPQTIEADHVDVCELQSSLSLSSSSTKIVIQPDDMTDFTIDELFDVDIDTDTVTLNPMATRSDPKHTQSGSCGILQHNQHHISHVNGQSSSSSHLRSPLLDNMLLYVPMTSTEHTNQSISTAEDIEPHSPKVTRACYGYVLRLLLQMGLIELA